MRSVEEHLARCLAAVAVLAPREVPLLDAVGRVLAADVVADAPLPAFASSAMDGYAVFVGDVAGASEGSPVVLPVTGDLPAGAPAPLELTAGSAIRIMTGAPLPHGTEAVVPVEGTDAGTVRVAVRTPVRPGQHLRGAGEDVARGELLLTRGTRLRPRHVALLAATGRAAVAVHPAPRVAVLSTGDELVEPGLPVGFGQVHESNSWAIVAAAREAGARAHRVPPVGDDPGAAPGGTAGLLATLRNQAAGADVLITTGGVSAGAYDVVKEVLRATGDVEFTPVAMQPGKPQGLGAIDGVPLFTLPGNPVSAFVSFEVFVRPALRAVLGHSDPHRPRVGAVAATGWRSPSGRRQFVRGVLGTGPDGRRTVAPAGAQGSHLVADLALADCLVDVPADVEAVEAGASVRCLLLDADHADHALGGVGGLGSAGPDGPVVAAGHG